jgi:hypothetical protein
LGKTLMGWLADGFVILPACQCEGPLEEASGSEIARSPGGFLPGIVLAFAFVIVTPSDRWFWFASYAGHT